ncbi:MAG: ester cyclase [Ginsengibacter sp.]
MESTIVKPASVSTQSLIDDYFASGHDAKYLAEDAIFTDMSNGNETNGREGVKQMLEYMYHVAFDAKAEVTNQVIAANKAAVEFKFRGKQIGEFAGLPPTNKEVNVPVCVVYDIENGLIQKARIYLLTDTMMKQLTS